MWGSRDALDYCLFGTRVPSPKGTPQPRPPLACFPLHSASVLTLFRASCSRVTWPEPERLQPDLEHICPHTFPGTCPLLQSLTLCLEAAQIALWAPSTGWLPVSPGTFPCAQPPPHMPEHPIPRLLATDPFLFFGTWLLFSELLFCMSLLKCAPHLCLCCPRGLRPHPGRFPVCAQFSSTNPPTILSGSLACFYKHTLVSCSLASVTLHL